MDKLAATGVRPHTDFIDRLRVVLTALVIVHHAAITYGGSGGWFYREVTDSGLPSSMGLTLLTAVNQTFFMGMFFLMSGYFTPASLAKKGAARFLGDRLLRLGVPLLVFGFVLGPLTAALAGAPSGQPVVGRWVELMTSGVFIIGPLWFALALLIFAIGWVVWATVRSTRAEAALEPGPSVPAWPSWLMAAVGVGAAALLLRQWMPVGQSLFGLQLGYFASYAFLFALGCHAASGRWLERVGAAQAKGWAIVSVLALPVVFIAAALSASPDDTAANVNGGLGLAAVVYAFWEPFVAWGIITSLLYVFRTRFNRASAQWSRWSNQAYGAFIVHAPVLVGISALASGWKGPVLLKFVAVTVLATVLSFGIAGWLRRLPGATRIL